MSNIAAVAQLDRVLGYEPRGRGFNSCQPHQNHVVRKKPELKFRLFFGHFFDVARWCCAQRLIGGGAGADSVVTGGLAAAVGPGCCA